MTRSVGARGSSAYLRPRRPPIAMLKVLLSVLLSIAVAAELAAAASLL